MTSPPQEMVERARAFFTGWDFVCDDDKRATVESLAHLLTSERERALEEAAKLCELSGNDFKKSAKALKAGGFPSATTRLCADSILLCAEDIRSLKSTPGAQPGGSEG